jgi:hypothetical protein
MRVFRAPIWCIHLCVRNDLVCAEPVGPATWAGNVRTDRARP